MASTTQQFLDEVVATGSSAVTERGISFRIDSVRKACVVLDQRFGERTKGLEDHDPHTFDATRRLTINDRTVIIVFTYDKYYGPNYVQVRGLGQVTGLSPRHLYYEEFFYLIDALLLNAPNCLYEDTTDEPYFIKIQLCAKRFLARKKLAELKQIISGDICAKCMTPLILGRYTTPCGQFFHTNCIDRWMHIKLDCPMCRRTDEHHLIKIQLFAKRYLARKKLAELKQRGEWDICMVCMAPVILGRHTTPCGHLFHTNCIDSWKAITPTCPMCRTWL